MSFRTVASGTFEHRRSRHTGDFTALRTGACAAVEGVEATAEARNVSHHWHLLSLCAFSVRAAAWPTGEGGGTGALFIVTGAATRRPDTAAPDTGRSRLGGGRPWADYPRMPCDSACESSRTTAPAAAPPGDVAWSSDPPAGTDARKALLALVSDIGSETSGGAAVVKDGTADGGNLLVAGPAVDRHREAVIRPAPRDHCPQTPRAAPSLERHVRASPLQGDDPTPPRKYRHHYGAQAKS